MKAGKSTRSPRSLTRGTHTNEISAKVQCYTTKLPPTQPKSIEITPSPKNQASLTKTQPRPTKRDNMDYTRMLGLGDRRACPAGTLGPWASMEDRASSPAPREVSTGSEIRSRPSSTRRARPQESVGSRSVTERDDTAPTLSWLPTRSRAPRATTLHAQHRSPVCQRHRTL